MAESLAGAEELKSGRINFHVWQDMKNKAVLLSAPHGNYLGEYMVFLAEPRTHLFFG
jgi:hypothetical protein